MLLILLDLLLALGLALRATRVITGDDIGLWYVRGPAAMWATSNDYDYQGSPIWRQRLVSGLGCPYCVGFWVGCVVLLSLWLAGGPGVGTWEPWRWVAGAFTMNYIAAHLGARLGDTD